MTVAMIAYGRVAARLRARVRDVARGVEVLGRLAETTVIVNR